MGKQSRLYLIRYDKLPRDFLLSTTLIDFEAGARTQSYTTMFKDTAESHELGHCESKQRLTCPTMLNEF